MANPILRMDKPPYLLTLLISLIGFQINYITKSLTETPLVEYKFDRSEQSMTDTSFTYLMKCNIANLSSDKLFKKVKISVAYPSSQSQSYYFTSPDITIIHPSSLTGPKYVLSDNIVSFFLENVQPQFKYILTAKIVSKKRIETNPFLYVDCEEPMIVKEGGIETFLVENKLAINIALTICLLCLGAAYLRKV